MSARIRIKQIEPEAYKAMMVLENYVKSTDLDPILKELIKVRVSQINGCKYCIEMHTDLAIKLGEKASRLASLHDWKKSDVFSEIEKIALKLAEEVTNISFHGLSDETYREAIQAFNENQTAQLIMLTVLINGWNRIATATKLIYQ